MKTIWLLLALAAAPADPAEAPPEAPAILAPVSLSFSPEEIERLERGEAVTEYLRQVDANGDQTGYAVSTIKIDRPAEEVWLILLDIERYHEYFPGILRARTLQRDYGTRKVHFHTETYILEPKFIVDMKLDWERMRMIYSLDTTQPVDFYHRMNGFWQVNRWGRGASLATYRLDAGVDFPVPDFILNPIIESLAVSSLPKVMKALGERAKKLAGAE